MTLLVRESIRHAGGFPFAIGQKRPQRVKGAYRMKTGFEIFLIAAEELSISRAAQKAFVTQQCVSDHIKRLEKEYGVELFERKPKFRLTPAGEIMRHSLWNIQIMEKSMSSSLEDIARGERGKFTLGISTSRAPIIMPGVLSRYYQMFPNVNISFCVEDTPILEERLLRGDIDLFIGINTDPHQDFYVEVLAPDEIMLIISSGLLHRFFEPAEIKRMATAGVDMTRFTNIPFTLSFKTGKVNRVIQEYLNYYNLQLNVVYNISDSETQIMLCAAGICASLCPRMLLSSAHRHNLTCEEPDKLYMLPIKNLDRRLHIDLVSHRNVVQPLYIREFMQILREEVGKIACESFDR